MIYLITNKREEFNLPPEIEFAEVEDCLKYFKNEEEVEVDTETEGFDCYTCKVLSLQLGDNKNQYVVDTLTVDITLFKEILESKLILLQNAKFDLQFLYYNGIFPTNVYDTFLAECVLHMGKMNVRKGLDVLVEKYCQIVVDKSLQANIHKEGLSNRGIIYAATDVKYLGEIKKKQIENLKAQNIIISEQMRKQAS